MIRTEVYLTEEQNKALNSWAHADSMDFGKKVSLEDLIRSAIDFYLESRSNFFLIQEVALLGQSKNLKQIVRKSLKQIKAGSTRNAEEFFDEL